MVFDLLRLPAVELDRNRISYFERAEVFFVNNFNNRIEDSYVMYVEGIDRGQKIIEGEAKLIGFLGIRMIKGWFGKKKIKENSILIPVSSIKNYIPLSNKNNSTR